MIEKKKVKLNDEELEKVNGGMPPNSEGYYEFKVGDKFRDYNNSEIPEFTVLQEKTTKDRNDSVYCEERKGTYYGVTTHTGNQSVYYLVDWCTKVD